MAKMPTVKFKGKPKELHSLMSKVPRALKYSSMPTATANLKRRLNKTKIVILLFNKLYNQNL